MTNLNKIEHSQVIEAAARLGLRAPLVRLLSHYLTERTTEVRWGRTTSSLRPIRGGCGQGTLLSVLLYIIIADPLLRDVRHRIDILEPEVKHKSDIMMFVDDLSLRTSYNRELFKDGKFADIDSRMCTYLQAIADFCSRTGMVLNKDKTSSYVALALTYTDFVKGPFAIS